MSESRSCKKLIREKLHWEEQSIFVWVTGTSCLPSSDVSCFVRPSLQCKCERWFWLSILTPIKAERCRYNIKKKKDNLFNVLLLGEIGFMSQLMRGFKSLYLINCCVHVLFFFTAQCRTISWSCTSRSTTACWSASLRRSSSAYWPAGLRRKPRGSYHSSLVTRK